MLKPARWALCAVALGAIGIWVYIAIVRVRYPYELEWLESGVLDHVRRISHGQPLYTPPSADFIQFGYSPGYFYAGWVSSWLFGINFAAVRVLSIVATCGTLVLLYSIVVRETQQRWAGVVAAGAYAASFGHVGGWFDIGKPDSLFLFLAVAACAVLLRSDNTRQDVVAGVLFALSMLTKQTTLFFVAPVLVYLLITKWRRALLIGSVTLGIVAVVALVMQGLSHGWFSYFTWTQLIGHGDIPKAKWDFWRVDLKPYWPVAILVLASVPVWVTRERRWKSGLVGAIAVGLLAGSWVSRLHAGGGENVLMPACLAMAMLLGLSAGYMAARKSQLVGLGVVAICLMQFGFLRYEVGNKLPTHANKLAGDRFVNWIHSVDGDVLVMSHPTYAVMGGKPEHAHTGGAIDVLRAKDERAKRDLRNSFALAIHEHKYAAIVLDVDGDSLAFPDDWQQFYERVPVDFFVDGNAFRNVASNTAEPNEIWVPRP